MNDKLFYISFTSSQNTGKATCICKAESLERAIDNLGNDMFDKIKVIEAREINRDEVLELIK